MKPPILNYLVLAISLVFSSQTYALEILEDLSLGETTGEGIAFLPENIKIVFDDTAYIRTLPSTTTPAFGQKAELLWYGVALTGASGRMVNSYIQLRGVSTNGLAAPTDNNATNTHILNNVLGFASNNTTTGAGAENTVIGSNGVLLHFRGEFTAKDDAMLGGDNTKATTLELGGAGTNTFGFEFGELQPLVSGSTDRAYFDSGDIYFNSVNTRHLRMPENSVLRTSRFGGTTNTFLTDSSDYVQQVHNFTDNPYSLVTTIRGSEFQALSKRGRFTSSSNVSAGNAIAARYVRLAKDPIQIPFCLSKCRNLQQKPASCRIRFRCGSSSHSDLRHVDRRDPSRGLSLAQGFRRSDSVFRSLPPCRRSSNCSLQ